MIGASYIGGGAGEMEIASSAIVALDHDEERGLWTRRAKWDVAFLESHKYSL